MEWIVIALALCVVCVVGLALIARRKKASEVRLMLRTKLEYEDGLPKRLYVFEDGATKTTGLVWKTDYYDGTFFSKTGFDGPYTKVEVPYAHE